MPHYTSKQVIDALWGPPPSAAKKSLEDLRKRVKPPEKPKGMTSEFNERLTSWKDFYRSHNLENYAQNLPEELILSPKAEQKIREAMEQGFDRMVFVPSVELQLQSTDALIQEMANTPVSGLKDEENDQYGKHNKPYVDDTAKASTIRPNSRPSNQPYILLYQSAPIPQETKSKTYPQLEELFKTKGWDGLTLQEYLLLQRLECETNHDHSFDAYNVTDASKSNWSFLLDSQTPSGVVNASWSPESHQVSVSWYGSTYSNSGLGARPAVVVRL